MLFIAWFLYFQQFGEAGDHGPLAPETVPPTTSSDTEAVSNRMEGVDQPKRIISLVKDSDVTVSLKKKKNIVESLLFVRDNFLWLSRVTLAYEFTCTSLRAYIQAFV